MITTETFIPFLISVIIMTALSTIILYYFTKKIFYSAIIAFIKYSICSIYFVIWSQYNPIVLLDDQTYFHQSNVIYENARGSVGYLFSFENIAIISSLAGGSHFGYYIYNFLSFIIFGQNYYAPVLLNILFSIITGIILYNTLILVSANKKFSLFFFTFFLLHWDMITWSSFINLKDILVLFLTVWALYCMVKIKITTKRVMPIISLIIIGFILLFFRFYLVYFLIVVGCTYWMLTQLYKFKSEWKNLFTKSIILIFVPISFYLTFMIFSSSFAEVGETTNIIFGFIRFLTTPIPFKINEGYSFLLISSILHWISLPFMFYGLYLFIKRYFADLMPFILLALILSVFYGSFSDLQEPRHRVVLLYFITLLQAMAIYELLNFIIIKSKSIKCVGYSEQH